MLQELILGALNGRTKGASPSPSKLSFAIENGDQGECVRETCAGIKRRIAKTGNSYSYIIGEKNLGARDLSAMEFAKACVIERLSDSGDQISMMLFNAAKDIAREELLRRTDPESASYLSHLVAHDTVGSGPFSILMEDKAGIEEIEVNSAASPITVYTTDFGRCSTNIRFASEAAFRHCVNKFIIDTEKELSEESPIIDAQVDDARVHAQMRPYVLSGAAASVRIGKGKSIGLLTLLKGQTFDVNTLAYLWLAIDSGMNIVISGAPASGKTTMLGAIANLMPFVSKAVIVEEEINELRFSMPMGNIVSLYGSRYGATNSRTQTINALRMRPDRIILGEMRGEEARELFSGANLGIPFITTMHSNDDDLSIVKRLLVKPMSVEPRSLSMLDLSICMRQPGVRTRIVSSIREYRWLSRAEIEQGTEVGDGDSVESSMVTADGRTKEEAIFQSKAMLCYAKCNKLTVKSARKELERRLDFLREISPAAKSDESLADAIAKYRKGAVSE